LAVGGIISAVALLVKQAVHPQQGSKGPSGDRAQALAH
jgi:hypothetical protein